MLQIAAAVSFCIVRRKSDGHKRNFSVLILFGANLLQAITGFAGTLISMPPTMKINRCGRSKGTAECNCTDFQSDDCNYRIPAY